MTIGEKIRKYGKPGELDRFLTGINDPGLPFCGSACNHN